MTVRTGVDMTSALDAAAFVYPRNRAGNSFVADIDSTPPTVSNITPAITFTINPGTFLGFDITSPTPLKIVVVSVVLDPNAAPEVVHDNVSFTPLYVVHGSKTAITDSSNHAGFRFSFLRGFGWPLPPRLTIYAANAGGGILIV